MGDEHVDNDQFTIQYRTGGGNAATVPLGDRPLLLGSAAQADVRIDSPYVSRRHLQLWSLSGHVYLTDLGGQNGTYLNGLRLSPNQQVEWRPGDSLAIANISFGLSSTQAVATPKK